MTKPIDRATRRFLRTATGVAAAGGLSLLAPSLRAQPAPREGTEYRPVNPKQPTDADGKIEVLEFFWYGCPHCNSFEPSLGDWVKRLPGDVAFQKVHVGLVPSWVAHQQLYYTLLALGKGDTLNDKIFHAIHVDKKPLNKPEAMAEFLAPLGVDSKQFKDAYASFGVRTRMRKATQQATSYGLDGVPALAVNGKWFTAPSMAGGNGQVLQVLDFLVQRERKA